MQPHDRPPSADDFTLPPGYDATPLALSPELRAIAIKLLEAGVLVLDPLEIGTAAKRGAAVGCGLARAQMEVADIGRQIGRLGHTFVATRLARAVAAMEAVTGAIERGQLLMLAMADPPVTAAPTPPRTAVVVDLAARRELARFNEPLNAEPKEPTPCA